MNKFIINDGKLVLGDVEFHSDLPGDHKKTIGGGRFHVEPAIETVYFYGISTDFGNVSPEEFKSALHNSSLNLGWKSYKIIFSNKLKFEEVLIENR